MSNTDYLRLGEHKIFKEFFSSAPKTFTETLNVLTVRDSVLYTWDFQNNCVLTLNVKAVRGREGDNVIHQVSTHISPKFHFPCTNSQTFINRFQNLTSKQ